MNFKLGKKEARFDRRTLQLGAYLGSLPEPPKSVSWTKGITQFGSMLNNDLGDCTIAGVGHAIQIWSANTGTEVTVPDSVILSYYEKWDGYNPQDPSSDQGGVELDVLNNWRKTDFSGHKLLAYADPSPNSITHVKQSIQLFGGLYIGLQLPETAQNQDVWDVVSGIKRWFTTLDPTPGSWGGHCVFVPAYNETGPIAITWGIRKQLTWSFWQKYCDESHALISQDWLNSNNIDPSGVNLQQLQQDLNLVIN